MRKIAFFFGTLLLVTVFVAAHPHISKTITTKVDATEVQLAYYTAPANMEHVGNAAAGDFSTTRAVLTLSADHSAGSVSLKAGDYTVGAVKQSDGTWTMGLYPGKMSYGDEADASKVIQLNSMFSKDHGHADHSHFDISPGGGSLSGKTVVTWHFGDLFLAGALN